MRYSKYLPTIGHKYLHRYLKVHVKSTQQYAYCMYYGLVSINLIFNIG